VNRQQNWGNSIVIRHAEGLFTKMSHLRKDSFRVKVGDFVKQGEVVAACGNSGRSPEPHLHFQVQSTPYVGSKSLAYPIESFIVRKDVGFSLMEFAVPAETQQVSQPVVNESLVKAFEFLPGYRMEVSSQEDGTAVWEVFTDAFNQTYLYCHTTKASAYFNRTGSSFYFTAFYGDVKCLLYQFYVSCFKISLSTDYTGMIRDEFPLQWSRNNPGKWVQDFAAPFYIFRHLLYESENVITGGGIFDPEITIRSARKLRYTGFVMPQEQAAIRITDKRIQTIIVERNNKKTIITCTPKG
jgi:murein DD-endopeptidase MepM/ murein hydrolase activator NlpD